MLEIAEERRAEMQRHAVEEYPRECCGILIGRVDGERAVVLRVVAARNIAEAGRLADRYVVEPLAIVRADREASASGIDIIGFYHSHPDHPARPSDTDREMAWKEYAYVIVAVTQEGPGEMRGWRVEQNGAAMREVPVHP